ncbi:MAG: hypothetical protein ACRDRG_19025 [Pseudonocardiaceae bacterium]
MNNHGQEGARAAALVVAAGEGEHNLARPGQMAAPFERAEGLARSHRAALSGAPSIVRRTSHSTTC